MKRILVLFAALFAAFALVSSASAAPENEYLVVRVLPTGTEMTLETFAYDETSFEDEQRIRAITFFYTYAERTNNPAWHIIIYGPTNGGPYTADDIIWDSTINITG